MATLRIGLTGGIASGKSAAARRFAELGATVIDADVIARTVVEPGQPGLAAIVAEFGVGVLGPDGRLDRARLRTLVFSNPARRRALEALLHPIIRAEMDRLAAAAAGPYVVLAIPLLVETGRKPSVDRVLVIDCPTELQVQRLMQRDGETPQGAAAILAAQASRADRLAAADDVIVNDGSLAALEDAVTRLDERYRQLAPQPG